MKTHTSERIWSQLARVVTISFLVAFGLTLASANDQFPAEFTGSIVQKYAALVLTQGSRSRERYPELEAWSYTILRMPSSGASILRRDKRELSNSEIALLESAIAKLEADQRHDITRLLLDYINNAKSGAQLYSLHVSNLWTKCGGNLTTNATTVVTNTASEDAGSSKRKITVVLADPVIRDLCESKSFNSLVHQVEVIGELGKISLFDVNVVILKFLKSDMKPNRNVAILLPNTGSQIFLRYQPDEELRWSATDYRNHQESLETAIKAILRSLDSMPHEKEKR